MPAPSPDAPLPPLAALRIVAWVVATLFAQVLPLLVRRPDLRVPLLRATRALAAAGWAYARGEDRHALAAAVLALRKVLRRVIDEGCAPVGSVAPRVMQEARLMPCAAAPAPTCRARDGPAAFQRDC